MTKNRVPRWALGLLAVSALLASGINVGVMSVEGTTGIRIVQAVGFGLLGLIMFWGATHRHD